MEPQKLFDGYPELTDGVVCLHKMTLDDADALDAFVHNENIYTYLPTFLYECKYADARTTIERMDEECLATHESILLGVYLASDPDTFVGIGEIYNYEEDRRKASIGCRLSERVWGQGVGLRCATLLRDYLVDCVGIQVITAHAMVDNAGSAAILKKIGFFVQDVDYHVPEDWGFPEPVIVDKYVYLANGAH